MSLVARLCAGALAALVTLSVDVARACPSCASPLEENRQAFVDTTIFLTVVPLMMIGGLIWWIRRKVRERDAALEIAVPESLLHDGGRFQQRGR